MNSKLDIQGSSFYGGILVVVLAAGWLLPNHYPPWNTFHSNAWVAGALLALCLWQRLNDPEPLRVSRPAVFIAACASIPLIQHLAGLIGLPSAALLSSLYLVGLAAAFAMGQNSARSGPGDLAGMVLVAACVASVVSVGLQTFQWLGLAEDLDLLQAWIFPAGRSRPVANLGQPNQLASLLLWGVLGAAWAWYKGWIGRVGATVLAAFILFGVALTESRTALLTLTMAAIGLSLWRAPFIERRVVRWAQVLYGWYFFCLFGLAPLSRLAGIDSASLTVFKRSAGEVRFALWRLALDASSQRPWQGFGWDEFNEGFLLVFPRHLQFIDLYAERSHNLMLDLVLWVGWPLAVALALCIGWWLLKLVRSVSDTGAALKVGALGVMLVHAMLELPLHYGYFLWPFGIIAGSASASLGFRAVTAFPRKAVVSGLAVMALVLGTVVHDYFNIEASFAELRFQLQRIGRNHDETPPRTFLLTAWPDFIAMSRTPPSAGMSESEIRAWEHLLIYNTSPLAFRKLVGALALNGRLDEAKYWSERYCAVLPTSLCKGLLQEWVPPTPPAP